MITMFSMLFVWTLSLSLLSRVDLVPCLSVSLVPSLTFQSKLYSVLSVAEGGLRYKSIGEASLATLSGYHLLYGNHLYRNIEFFIILICSNLSIGAHRRPTSRLWEFLTDTFLTVARRSTICLKWKIQHISPPIY